MTDLELGKKRAEELGLKSLTTHYNYGAPSNTQITYAADDIHALLGAGVEVVGSYNSDTKQITSTFGQILAKKDHDQALLIGIQPIKKATREERALGLLQELVSRWNPETVDYDPIMGRAKALLSEDK